MYSAEMSLPNNFASSPGEELHSYFRNLCLEFKKIVKKSKDIDELQIEMEKFINASRDMNWHHKSTGVYHKEEGEKATGKVWKEFKRYLFELLDHPEDANPQNLLDALAEVERLVEALKVT